ncbi:hypothetical protein M2475_001672 [Breznakia sp. PF5-3]|uniref:discoidin domain-containing protein n=1 Tax=unclassified Breznakia TaxID=2623764 RepID=UPI0024063185|nr:MULTISPECIES: discoidin domain-containing protein [unclassified Breznakia]MDF9825215.1 hypothetical protein [Breznakia sp. PM6-1]MDF9836096.1 hypothetical protein [Breznakia sp. PF5-3]
MKLKKSIVYLLVIAYFFSFLPETQVLVSSAETGDVEVTKTSSYVEIGNESLSRRFGIENNKLITEYINNKRIGKKLEPDTGSDDFVIRVLGEKSEVKDTLPVKELERDNWSGTLSQADGVDPIDAAKLFDGNDTTEVEYAKGGKFPYAITVNLNEVKTFQSFSFQKRMGNANSAWGINGTIGKFSLETSTDGNTWTAAGTGEFTKEAYNLHLEDGKYNTADLVYANFDSPQTAQYVRIMMLSGALSTNQSFCGAEIRLYEDKYVKAEREDEFIRSSDLEVKEIKENNIDNGKEIIVDFKPYMYKSITWDLSYHVVMKNDDYFMRTFVEIGADDKEKARIDYLALDHFVLNTTAEDVWSRPDSFKVADGQYNFLAHEMQLGQPIYATGLFFGSEFPATDTNVVDDVMEVRYYSGKSIAQFEEEGSLNNNRFVSWPNVVGAAEGTDMNVVQTDFFAYIDTIATETNFRKQYNSWYENRMGITDESIQRIFYASEKGLSENGVEPLDSYVVDDGWNNYNDPTFTKIDVERSGNSYNRTGFWEFNDKFPNELYPSMEMAHKFNSTFGLWLGPQGGYELYNTFSQYLESKGTAYVHHKGALGKVVDAGSKVYLGHLKNLFVDYQSRFDIDYWKLDGFASRPNDETDNDHMSGGDNNMYYTSELWENWIKVFEAMRSQRAAEGKGLFINATCYVNPSPWHLQWVNTIWQQNAGDLASDASNGGSQSAKMISGRDNVYFVNGVDGQFQFPLKNVYNHEPIYGKSANVSMTTDEFREYLVGNAVRGTAFWELYFSPSMLDDAKWKVTAEVLDFAEENQNILAKAKLFGNAPKTKAGIYGYSAWDGNEGIVYFRNPTNAKKTYSFTYDDVAGVPKTVNELQQVQVYPYKNAMDNKTISYGDKVEISLEPYELVVYQYGKKDTDKPEIESIKNIDDKTIQVIFNERISDDMDITLSNATVKSIKLLADYKTVNIVSEEQLSDDVNVDLKYQDIAGNEKASLETVNIYEENVVASLKNKDTLKNTEEMTEAKLERSNIPMPLLDGDVYELKDKNTFDGKGDFSLSFIMKSGSKNTQIYKQKDFEVGINSDGYIYTTIAGNTFDSKDTVTEVVELEHGLRGSAEYVPTSTTTKVLGLVADDNLHTVVVSKERNGLCKIYVDGELRKSLYLPDVTLEAQTGSKITLGSDEFVGYVGNVMFRNRSVGYDEAIKIKEDLLLSGNVIADRSEWTATASSEYAKKPAVEGPAGLAIDGDTGTLWHTNWAAPYPEPRDHWIAIDFGKEETFDKVLYTGRGANTNGNVKDYIIQIKDESDKWIDIKSGQLADGGLQTIELDEKVTSTAMRIKAVSSYGKETTHAAAVEINISCSLDELADYNSFRDSVDAIKVKDKNKYTEDSYQAYKDAYDALVESKLILDIEKNTVNQLWDVFTDAESKLVEKPIVLDTKALEDAIKNAEAIDLNLYTKESTDALKDAIKSAKDVVANATTQEEINTSVSNLNAAVNNLVEKTKELDTSELKKMIDQAENMDLSNYTSESVANLQKEITNAKDVLANATTQEALDDALQSLVKAMNGLVEIHPSEGLTYRTLVSEDGKVKVSGYLHDDVKLIVKRYQNLKAFLKDIKDKDYLKGNEILAAYDIELQRNGEKYIFDRPVKVEIKTDDKMNGKPLRIVHIDENKDIIRYDSKVEKEYIGFHTTHLSDYAISTVVNGPKPSTGDNSNTAIYMSLLLMSLGIVIRKSYKKMYH